MSSTACVRFADRAARRPADGRRRGFSIVELLTVIGVIVLLVAILLPVLGLAKGMTKHAKSQSNMRQVATMMRSYAADFREYVVPSQFDYSTAPLPGKVRSEVVIGGQPFGPELGDENEGTWSDILWTTSGQRPLVRERAAGPSYDYRYDSPDRVAFDENPDVESVFRSAVANTRNVPGGGEALPFGKGAVELGAPGYFAANDFFNSRADAPGGGKWYTTGQIRRPAQSVYLVDSFYGEIIPPTDAAWEGTVDSTTGQIDFRYPGDTVIMLFLDGHVETKSRWETLTELTSTGQVRVQSLDQGGT